MAYVDLEKLLVGLEEKGWKVLVAFGSAMVNGNKDEKEYLVLVLEEKSLDKYLMEQDKEVGSVSSQIGND